MTVIMMKMTNHLVQAVSAIQVHHLEAKHESTRPKTGRQTYLKSGPQVQVPSPAVWPEPGNCMLICCKPILKWYCSCWLRDWNWPDNYYYLNQAVHCIPSWSAHRKTLLWKVQSLTDWKMIEAAKYSQERVHEISAINPSPYVISIWIIQFFTKVKLQLSCCQHFRCPLHVFHELQIDCFLEF